MSKRKKVSSTGNSCELGLTTRGPYFPSAVEPAINAETMPTVHRRPVRPLTSTALCMEDLEKGDKRGSPDFMTSLWKGKSFLNHLP